MSNVPPTTKQALNTQKATSHTNGTPVEADLSVTLDVEPRQPRLAWQGMGRKEAAVSVPTQVVEIVRPGKAIASDDKLPGITAAQQTGRA
ncbi:MAG: hypothetical protein ACREJ3_09345, partial [Polyangiaceae bacterium]